MNKGEDITVATYDEILLILKRLGVVSLEDERWKPILDYPGYFVSNFGRVLGKTKIHKWQHNKRGGFYPYVNLYRIQDGKRIRKNVNVHTLVARVFIGPKPKGMLVHHKDNNRQNPSLDNLEYVTFHENNKSENRKRNNNIK